MANKMSGPDWFFNLVLEGRRNDKAVQITPMQCDELLRSGLFGNDNGWEKVLTNRDLAAESRDNPETRYLDFIKPQISGDGDE